MPGPRNTKRGGAKAKGRKPKQTQNAVAPSLPKQKTGTAVASKAPVVLEPAAPTTAPAPSPPLGDTPLWTRPRALDPLEDPRYPPFDASQYAIWQAQLLANLKATFDRNARARALAAALSPAVSNPYVEQTSRGIRVRNARTFVASPLASPPADAAEAPLCAELAQEEVLDMLRELLPDELAVVRPFFPHLLHTITSLCLDHLV
jgi:hypothetical protein